MDGPVDVLEYFKKAHVASEQRIFIDYFRDIIRAYGISATYFRQDNKFPERIYERFQDLIYQEHIPTFSLSAEIKLYLESSTDAFMLSKFGIEPDQKYVAYFMIKDFEFAFAELANQHWISGSIELEIPVSAGSGIISSQMISEDNGLSGVISSSFYIPTTGAVDGISTAQYHNYQNHIYTNPDIYWPNQWDYIKTTFSSFHGPYTGTLDENGNGTINTLLRGIVLYKKISDLETNSFRKVKPLPKDYFKIAFPDRNYEEFEIVHPISRNLMPNGLNPLLTEYVFACNVQRREYSHEDGLGSSEDAIKDALEMEDTIHQSHEFLSNDIKEYRSEDIDLIDKAKSDNVYGGYGSSGITIDNKPLSAISVSGYNDPISGIIYEFFFGSKLFSDGFNIYFSQAGSDIGTSLINPVSTLPVSTCSGNYTKVRYLESDMNQLYFINISGTSAIIESDQIDNQYLREMMEINGVFETTTNFYSSSGMVKTFANKSSLFSDGQVLYYIDKNQDTYQF